MTISLPYGRGQIAAQLPDSRVSGIGAPVYAHQAPTASPEDLVAQALQAPIQSPPLEELARGKRNIVILASDHTRPVPSRIILPPMLRAIRRASPQAEVTILIATGCHRGTTTQELAAKFGPEIMAQANILASEPPTEHSLRIAIHDCADAANMVPLGPLPSGGPCRINRIAAQADLLISEGFIEPHFFAGYSGGRKSVLPGVAARETVYANHCSAFLADPHARAGVLDGNPLHKDMLWAARQAGLAFICNVVLNSQHQVLAAFAGDMDAAHRAGCRYLEDLCQVRLPMSDIVLTTNGGYPLDQNIYQAVKGMSTAESVCRPGGVIIIAAACEDGCCGEAFRRTFQAEPDAQKILQRILAVPAHLTEADQWQSQVFARVLCRCHVVLVSQVDPQLVHSLHMHPAATVEEALAIADGLLGSPGSIAVIPDGVSTIAVPAV